MGVFDYLLDDPEALKKARAQREVNANIWKIYQQNAEERTEEDIQSFENTIERSKLWTQDIDVPIVLQKFEEDRQYEEMLKTIGAQSNSYINYLCEKVGGPTDEQERIF